MMGISHATVITTMPLTDMLRQKFKAMVTQATGNSTIELGRENRPQTHRRLPPPLGDRQIDSSLAVS